jgi:hypothetical protein
MSLIPWKQSLHSMKGYGFDSRIIEFVKYLQQNNYDMACLQEIFIWKILNLDSSKEVEIMYFYKNIWKI